MTRFIRGLDDLRYVKLKSSTRRLRSDALIDGLNRARDAASPRVHTA